MQIPMWHCKKRLVTVWGIGALVLGAVLIVQSAFGRYEVEEVKRTEAGGTEVIKVDKADDAWSWFLPHIVPTLSLMLGVTVMGLTGRTEKEQGVDQFVYRLCLWSSLAYLFLLALTFFLPPLTGSKALEFMKTSELWLAPTQGLVGISLGVFFVQRERPEEPPSQSGEHATATPG